MKAVRIGTREIGEGHPVYVIAEAGVNHNGDGELARKMIDAAQESGADAIKFQTFTVEEVVTDSATQALYQIANSGKEESQAAMLKRLALSYEDFRGLKTYAEARGIEFLSTPFSFQDADFLNSIGTAAFKISSGDLTNLPLLAHVAYYKKPILLSTGMATLVEIREAVQELRKAGSENIILLQCTSEYPTPLPHVNLRVLEALRSEFDLPIGFSDHTEEGLASIAAAALGACVIEKHFTLDRTLPGPDHRVSLEPSALKSLIADIRAVEQSLGSREKKPSPPELATAKLVRKGVAARKPIEQGEILTTDNIYIVRPEGEVPPKEWTTVLGKRTTRAIPAGTSLRHEMFE